MRSRVSLIGVVQISGSISVGEFVFPLLIIGGIAYAFIDFDEKRPSSSTYTENYDRTNDEDLSSDSTSIERTNEYHMTSDYTRSDGTHVSGYISGNPDGVQENNIGYMEEHGDSNGLQEAYDSLNR